MKRVAVISDSHEAEGYVGDFIRVAQRENFDDIIFCGDGLRDARRIERELGITVKAVHGNCDWFNRDAPSEIVPIVDGVRMLVTHGDRYNVKIDKTLLSYAAEERNAAVVLFGHTHEQMAGYLGNVLLVNPGTLRKGYYAVLEIEDGKVEPTLTRL